VSSTASCDTWSYPGSAQQVSMTESWHCLVMCDLRKFLLWRCHKPPFTSPLPTSRSHINACGHAGRWSPPANSAAADLLGPFVGDDPGDTELARPRRIQLIPCRYAANLVGEDGVHPRLAYQLLSATLEQDGTLEDC
jgi:hypothetical protein